MTPPGTSLGSITVNAQSATNVAFGGAEPPDPLRQRPRQWHGRWRDHGPFPRRPGAPGHALLAGSVVSKRRPVRCRGQVVRQRSAKPSFPGSNPGGTSRIQKFCSPESSRDHPAGVGVGYSPISRSLLPPSRRSLIMDVREDFLVGARGLFRPGAVRGELRDALGDEARLPAGPDVLRRHVHRGDTTANCGACGNVCGAGQVCQSGTLPVRGRALSCNGSASSDSSHCGTCTRPALERRFATTARAPRRAVGA